MKGIKRFRQAIKNQRDFGSGEFHLAYHDAEQIAAEIEDELAQLAWANGVPVPVDANGEVVPLTTKVMYDDGGREYKGSSYRSFIWSRERGQWYFGIAGGSREVASLHLRRPDSWERLEEDVEQFEDGGTACEYFGSELTSCNGCKSPCSIGDNCRNSVARDVLRRAKALAGRGED